MLPKRFLLTSAGLVSRLLYVGVFCICFMAAGCLQPTSPVGTPSAAAPENGAKPSHRPALAAQQSPHLSTSVEASRSMVTGSLNFFQLAVTNHEREPVTLGFGGTTQLGFVVYDLHGNQVSPALGTYWFPTTLTIGGGETVLKDAVWRPQRYDYGLHRYVPLPAGLYRMQAYVYEYGYYSPPFMVWVREP